MANNTEISVKSLVKVKYPKSEIASSIREAVTPDNIETPEGISIQVETKENILCIDISCSRGLSSFIATLDDLLSCVQAAEQALDKI